MSSWWGFAGVALVIIVLLGLVVRGARRQGAADAALAGEKEARGDAKVRVDLEEAARRDGGLSDERRRVWHRDES